MASLISQNLIDRYSSGPSQARIDQAKQLRAYVEEALGYGYRVFLQGSYRNSTGIADLNDIDIVALSETVHSTRGGPPATNPVSWDEIFSRVERRLDDHWKFNDLIERGDKCVKVDTDLSLDVIPAICRGSPAIDPIEIYSFREGSRRDNYPRDHRANGVEKNQNTNGNFKPTVRLIKRWAREILGDQSIAPSFYLECAAYNVADKEFFDYLPLSFASVGLEVCGWDRSKYIWTVAGDKDILLTSEWDPEDFERFKIAFVPSLKHVVDAIRASTTAEADRLWKMAFGD